MAHIKTAFNKFFFYTGLVAVIWFSSKLHSWATDTNPGINPKAVTAQVMTKADKIREQDSVNAGTLLMAFVFLGCFGFAYYKVLTRKKHRPIVINTPKPEKPKALQINREGEESLIQRYCFTHDEELSVLQIVDLFKAFPDYQTLQLTVIERYKNDLNFAQLDLIQKVSKEVKNEELGHRLRNLKKFWTQSDIAKARDKHESRRFYGKLLPPLSVERA